MAKTTKNIIAGNLKAGGAKNKTKLAKTPVKKAGKAKTKLATKLLAKNLKAGSGNKKSRRYKSKQHERTSRKEEDTGHNIKRKSKKHQVKARSKKAARHNKYGKSSTNTHTNTEHQSTEDSN